MTARWPAIISSRVSRLAAFRSSSVSTSLVCHNSPGHASVFPTALSQFTSSSLNSYYLRFVETSYYYVSNLPGVFNF